MRELLMIFTIYAGSLLPKNFISKVIIILTPLRYSFDDINFNLIQIIDKETSVEKPNSGFPGMQIIVDDEDNVDYVKDQLEKRGYKDVVLGVKEN